MLERGAQARQAPPDIGTPPERIDRKRPHVVTHRSQLVDVVSVSARLHGAHDGHLADARERPQHVVGAKVPPDVERQRHMRDHEERPHRGASPAGNGEVGAVGDADWAAAAVSGTSAAERKTISQKRRCASAETKKPAARNAVSPTSSASAVRVTSSGFVSRAPRIRSRLAYVATIVARNNN